MIHCTKKQENAVSPVVGVMLMLVVVIIIGAVVSGFAGGLVKGQTVTPSASIDVSIVNTGEWRGSYMQIAVKTVSEPFQSEDIKIITSWANATMVGNGKTVMKGLDEPNTHYGSTKYQAPLGFGPSVRNWTTSGQPVEQQCFGNYTITAGTIMKASPYGYTPTYGGYGVSNSFVYSSGSAYTHGTDIDSIQALLGKNWYELRTGDSVKVTIIHIPSGKTIFNKDVQVVG